MACEAISIGELARSALGQHVEVLLARDAEVRAGDDMEALHQMRVATRRLRAGLRLFQHVVPADADALRAELKWLANSLGAVRDLDVQLESLRNAAEDVHAQPEALAPLVAWFTERHVSARQALVECMDSERFSAVLSLLVALVSTPAATSGAPADAAETVVPELLRSHRRRFRKAARGLDSRSPAPNLHRARIRAKQLRYSLEFTERLYDKPSRSLIRRAVQVQDALGAIQDAVAMDERLHAVSQAGSELPPASMFLAGQLARGFAERQQAARAEVPWALKRLSRRRWRRLARRFGKPAPPTPLPEQPSLFAE